MPGRSEPDFRDVIEAAKILRDYDRPWAVCGGWAIDLFLDCVNRPHKDVDFAVLRKDQLAIQEYLSSRGWSLEKAVQGQLVPWLPDEWLSLPVHVIWCRKTNASPDFIELLLNEVDDDNFYYRRDPSITLPREKMILSSHAGLPILAPEIALLYKSKKPEEDSAAMADFRNVLPALTKEQRNWLAGALQKQSADHIWLNDLLSQEKESR